MASRFHLGALLILATSPVSAQTLIGQGWGVDHVWTCPVSVDRIEFA